LCQDEWQPLMAARQALPVLQTHGREDPLLSYRAAVTLRDLLRAAGLEVNWVEFRGGHEIPNNVLEALGAFITQRLG
jgi:phospholipase/carboxylesterase